MALQKTRKDFFDTEEGRDIQLEFQQMTSDKRYNTAPSYNSNTLRYPDNLIPFVDKHMQYLVNHPSLVASQYLANIKLITRKR
jgi:hypothetical protein